MQSRQSRGAVADRSAMIPVTALSSPTTGIGVPEFRARCNDDTIPGRHLSESTHRNT